MRKRMLLNALWTMFLMMGLALIGMAGMTLHQVPLAVAWGIAYVGFFYVFLPRTMLFLRMPRSFRQMMLDELGALGAAEGLFLAAANVAGGTGTARWARGGTSARTGAGVYTFTLDTAQTNADGAIFIQAEAGAGNTNSQLAHTSNTVKAVTTFVAAVATDEDWNILVLHRGT